MAYRTPLHRCPRCKAPLKAWKLVTSHPANGCDDCGGMFVDREVISALAELLSGRLPKESPSSPQRDDEQLTCPECASPLRPFLLEGVPVDRCERHGVWLDAKELQGILTGTATGEE